MPDPNAIPPPRKKRKKSYCRMVFDGDATDGRLSSLLLEMTSRIASYLLPRDALRLSETCSAFRSLGPLRRVSMATNIANSTSDRPATRAVCVAAGKWTAGGRPFEHRGLMKFDISNISIETFATASLDLHADTEHAIYGQGRYNAERVGHSKLSGENDFVLLRVTEGWESNSVIWDTLPSTTEQDSVLLEASTSHDQNYLEINVTNALRAALEVGETEFSLLMRLVNPSHYRCVQFAGHDHPQPSKRPFLNLVVRRAG